MSYHEQFVIITIVYTKHSRLKSVDAKTITRIKSNRRAIAAHDGQFNDLDPSLARGFWVKKSQFLDIFLFL